MPSYEQELKDPHLLNDHVRLLTRTAEYEIRKSMPKGIKVSFVNHELKDFQHFIDDNNQILPMNDLIGSIQQFLREVIRNETVDRLTVGRKRQVERKAMADEAEIVRIQEYKRRVALRSRRHDNLLKSFKGGFFITLHELSDHVLNHLKYGQDFLNLVTFELTTGIRANSSDVSLTFAKRELALMTVDCWRNRGNAPFEAHGVQHESMKTTVDHPNITLDCDRQRQQLEKDHRLYQNFDWPDHTRVLHVGRGLNQDSLAIFKIYEIIGRLDLYPTDSWLVRDISVPLSAQSLVRYDRVSSFTLIPDFLSGLSWYSLDTFSGQVQRTFFTDGIQKIIYQYMSLDLTSQEKKRQTTELEVQREIYFPHAVISHVLGFIPIRDVIAPLVSEIFELMGTFQVYLGNDVWFAVNVRLLEWTTTSHQIQIRYQKLKNEYFVSVEESALQHQQLETDMQLNLLHTLRIAAEVEERKEGPPCVEVVDLSNLSDDTESDPENTVYPLTFDPPQGEEEEDAAYADEHADDYADDYADKFM
jgi:hypothetical protein